MDVREKLVELLNKANSACVGTDCFEGCKFYMENDCLYKLMADVMIENGVTVQEWISVKDRLPEDDERIEFYDDGRMRCTTVLVYTEYGRIIPKNRLIVKPSGNEYLDNQVTDGWVWARGTEEITHWQPMPQPPKGE